MKKTVLLILFIIFASIANVEATLIDMGDGTIYDTDLQLSWLKDANYAKTSGFDADGFMTWIDAYTWANDLVFATFDNWRLPTTLQPDLSCSTQSFISYGYTCTGSEMGHLFYDELGGTAGLNILTSGDPDLVLFTNVQPFEYWSGTELGYALINRLIIV